VDEEKVADKFYSVTSAVDRGFSLSKKIIEGQTTIAIE
jgi:hypothetical protein